MVRMILGIIHYVGAVFLLLFFLGGAFFSLVAVGMMVVMMNGKHICPHKMVFFSFSSYIYLVQRTDFFFLLSHPRSYTCKDSYLMLALLLLL